MLRILLVLTSLGALAGCAYDLAFVCNPGAPDCPYGAACPAVPLGSGGCEDLPALYDHDPIPVDVGRPVGCEAALPYGNPYYGGGQQLCYCVAIVAEHPPEWMCPV